MGQSFRQRRGRNHRWRHSAGSQRVAVIVVSSELKPHLGILAARRGSRGRAFPPHLATGFIHRRVSSNSREANHHLHVPRATHIRTMHAHLARHTLSFCNVAAAWFSEFHSRRAEVLIRVSDSCSAHSQGARFRLTDGAVDDEPHLEMQNSTVQLVWELDELRITAQSWLVGMDEDMDLYMRIQTFLTPCTTMMSQCSTQRTVDDSTRWASDEMSADWSAMRSCVLDTPRRLLDVRSETESDDARVWPAQRAAANATMRCVIGASVLTVFTSVVCSVCSLWRPLCRLQWNFWSARFAGNISKRTEETRRRAKLQALERTLLELPKNAALWRGSQVLVRSWNPLCRETFPRVDMTCNTMHCHVHKSNLAQPSLSHYF